MDQGHDRQRRDDVQERVAPRRAAGRQPDGEQHRADPGRRMDQDEEDPREVRSQVAHISQQRRGGRGIHEGEEPIRVGVGIDLQPPAKRRPHLIPEAVILVRLAPEQVVEGRGGEDDHQGRRQADQPGFPAPSAAGRGVAADSRGLLRPLRRFEVVPVRHHPFALSLAPDAPRMARGSRGPRAWFRPEGMRILIHAVRSENANPPNPQPTQRDERVVGGSGRVAAVLREFPSGLPTCQRTSPGRGVGAHGPSAESSPRRRVRQYPSSWTKVPWIRIARSGRGTSSASSAEGDDACIGIPPVGDPPSPPSLSPPDHARTVGFDDDGVVIGAARKAYVASKLPTRPRRKFRNGRGRRRLQQS